MPAHPAFALFKTLFDKEAADAANNPNLPTHYVKRNCFHARCREAGIAVPEGFIEAVEWEESIGLVDYAHKIIAAHHKARGTDFTPMEKGAWRLRQKMKRQAQ